METGSSEILDKLDLALGVTSGGRNCHSTQPLSTVLEAQSACKHTIAAGVLEDIALTATYHIEVTGNHVRPRTDVMLGIDDDTGITRRTTCRVDTHGIIQTSTYEAIRIIVTQILLRGEGNLAEVIQRINGISGNTGITQTLLVERRFQGNVDALLQFLHLQLLELLSWHGL